MNNAAKHPPVLGIVGQSGSGKTTLLKYIIPLLRQNGLNIGLIKHTHHDIELDLPGKDSFELRKRGAKQVMIAGTTRWTMISESSPIALTDLTCQFNETDLILVEGFKNEPFPKIYLSRNTLGQFTESQTDTHVIAVASDIQMNISLPLLDLNHPAQICAFILHWQATRSV